jgi:hypothetical protein
MIWPDMYANFKLSGLVGKGKAGSNRHLAKQRCYTTCAYPYANKHRVEMSTYPANTVLRGGSDWTPLLKKEHMQKNFLSLDQVRDTTWLSQLSVSVQSKDGRCKS